VERTKPRIKASDFEKVGRRIVVTSIDRPGKPGMRVKETLFR
jgi:hypothetical protein